LSSAVCYRMPSLHGNDTRIRRVPDIRCLIYNQMTTYKFPVILGVTSMGNTFFNRKWFQSGIHSPFSVSPVMHTNQVIINPPLYSCGQKFSSITSLGQTDCITRTTCNTYLIVNCILLSILMLLNCRPIPFLAHLVCFVAG
jgi:hypothetical protein